MILYVNKYKNLGNKIKRRLQDYYAKFIKKIALYIVKNIEIGFVLTVFLLTQIILTKQLKGQVNTYKEFLKKHEKVL